MFKLFRKKEGFALITSVGLISTMTTMSLALMLSVVYESKSTEAFENRIVTFHAAEGALDQTIANLRADNTYAGLPATATAQGTVQTIVCSQQNAANCDDPANPPNADIYLIQATGSFGADANAWGFQQRVINTVIDLRAGGGFDFAIFSDGSIQMSGNAKTDSYNSNNGPYQPAFADQEGDIGTNLSTAHAVQMSGNAIVGGDAIVGPNSNVNTAVVSSGNARVEGNVEANTAIKALTPVAVPGNVACQGQLKINGNSTVTLNAGTYCYDGIQVNGNGKLRFNGAVEIYSTSSVKFNGNGVGTGQEIPSNFKLLVQGAHEVKISGNGNVYGAIYAPESPLSISGNGHTYGAIVGATLAMSGNALVHYDEALKDVQAGDGGGDDLSDDLISWLET